MELRDYLMPAEYILGIIRKIDVDYGKFSNLAITNKRFIAFNVKKKRSLFKSWEEVTDLKSVFFEGACGVEVMYNDKWLSINLCEKIRYNSQERSYNCYNKKLGVVNIHSKLTGPSIGGIASMIITTLDSISKKSSMSYDEKGLIWKTFLLKDDDECIK